MSFEAYFNDGRMEIYTDGQKAFEDGAYRVVPILDAPKTKMFTIKVVDDAGDVVQSVSAKGTLLDVTPEDVGMPILF